MWKASKKITVENVSRIQTHLGDFWKKTSKFLGIIGNPENHELLGIFQKFLFLCF